MRTPFLDRRLEDYPIVKMLNAAFCHLFPYGNA